MNGELATHVDQVRTLRDTFEYIHNSESRGCHTRHIGLRGDVQIYKIILLEVGNLFLGVAKYLGFSFRTQRVSNYSCKFQEILRYADWHFPWLSSVSERK